MIAAIEYVPTIVLSLTGLVALAALVRRQRAGQPLLRTVERPFRPARPGFLLLLAGGVFLGQQLGGLLVLRGGPPGGALGTSVPLALGVYAALLARRETLLPRGSATWRAGMGLLHVWAALPLVYGTFYVARQLGLAEQSTVGTLRDRAEGWQALAVTAVLVAPVAEEVCFRGLLYPALRARLGARDAVLFTSLAFALVHPPSVWVPMAILGAVLAWLVETTGSVVAPIAGHAAFNALNVAQILL